MIDFYPLRYLKLYFLAVASFCVVPASAQSVDLATLVLNGSATLVSGKYIQLTSVGSEAGSAFVPIPFTIAFNTAFEVRFVYNENNPAGVTPADGLAFVIQNTPMGVNYLGLGGSGLGFFTLTSTPAIAATFDFYSNAYTGTLANAASISLPIGEDLTTAYPEPPLSSGSGDAHRYVWVDYNNVNKAFLVFYSATSTKPATPLLATILTQDLSSEFGGEAYFGFTGGTGALYVQQYITQMFVHIVN